MGLRASSIYRPHWKRRNDPHLTANEKHDNYLQLFATPVSSEEELGMAVFSDNDNCCWMVYVQVFLSGSVQPQQPSSKRSSLHLAGGQRSEKHRDTGPADRGTHLFISGLPDNLTWTLPSNIHSKILLQKGWSVYKSDECPTITPNGHEPPALMTFTNDCMRHGRDSLACHQSNGATNTAAYRDEREGFPKMPDCSIKQERHAGR
ncbi:unnamed protein product [Pleuronectes platessa]|uniref:Uncharacterized protein n=1 Tax=Pleuronectes platessa TaxID=8262 RepID=A0A9N7VNP3_PLEPL|nr:unnamed protein product [Pleuronectes platessa]